MLRISSIFATNFETSNEVGFVVDGWKKGQNALKTAKKKKEGKKEKSCSPSTSWLLDTRSAYTGDPLVQGLSK
jgi:hypothetical protein